MFYLKKLIEIKELEKEQIDKANGKSSKGGISRPPTAK